MSFRLSVYSLRRRKMKCGMTKYMQKEAKKNYKSKVSTCKLGSYCLRRMLYLIGIGFELLSACLVPEVPSLQCFPNSKRTFVNDTRVVKIYAIVK